MLRYIFKRILYAIPVLIFISMASFAIIQFAPGDYATNYQFFLMTYSNMSEYEAQQAADIVRRQYGLDQPAIVQYFAWMRGMILEGRFGWSFSYRRDVSELFAERLPRTLILAISAHLISSVGGVLIGIYAATRKYSIGDNLATVLAFIGTCLPRFFLAIIMLYTLLFVVRVPQMGGWSSSHYVMAPMSMSKFWNIVSHVWPVVFIAGLGGIARNFRVMRGNLLDVLNAQYVTTARAKGLKERKVIMRHAVPNALHPIIMYQGMVFPYMVQGELETSIILSVPTMAPLFYMSLQQQDIYVAAGCVLIYSFILVLGNIIADITLAAVDPRVTTE